MIKAQPLSLSLSQQLLTTMAGVALEKLARTVSLPNLCRAAVLSTAPSPCAVCITNGPAHFSQQLQASNVDAAGVDAELSAYAAEAC